MTDGYGEREAGYLLGNVADIVTPHRVPFTQYRTSKLTEPSSRKESSSHRFLCLRTALGSGRHSTQKKNSTL